MRMIQVSEGRWISSDVIAELQFVRPEPQGPGSGNRSVWQLVTKRGERITIEQRYAERTYAELLDSGSSI